MQLRLVTHCLFDIDGLLLDTEPLYEAIVIKLCRKYGSEYTETIRQKVLGRKEEDMIRIVCKELNLTCTPEEFRKQYTEAYMVGLDDAKLLPGAEKLIRHLAKNNIPMALATSSSRSGVEAKTKNYRKLFSLFDHLVSGTSDKDVKNSKPAPDIFLCCASKFPNPPVPEKCLVFEDAPNGVQAAVAAGMQVVMVPDPRVPEEDCKLATQVLRSLEDFRPEDFGLPPY